MICITNRRRQPTISVHFSRNFWSTQSDSYIKLVCWEKSLWQEKQKRGFHLDSGILTWFARRGDSLHFSNALRFLSSPSSLCLLASLRAAPFAVCGLKALLTFTHQSGKKVYLISPKASLFFWKRRVIWWQGFFRDACLCTFQYGYTNKKCILH